MKRVDSQNPLRGRRVGIALAAAGCLLAMAALGSLDQAGRARGVPFLIPSLAASAAVLFAEPRSPAARPWNTIVGQTLSALAGWLCAYTLGGSFLAAALAVGLAVFAMQVTRSFHPPGAATAALAVMGLANYQTSSIHFVIFPVLAGAVILVAITRALRVALSPTLRETSPLVKDVQASVSAQLSPRQKEASWGNK